MRNLRQLVSLQVGRGLAAVMVVGHHTMFYIRFLISASPGILLQQSVMRRRPRQSFAAHATKTQHGPL